MIKPEYPLPLDPHRYLRQIDTANLIDMGYADAHTDVRQRRPEGVPFQPEATTMSEPTLGLMSRETMAGGFALGETDPRSGASKGLAAGTTVCGGWRHHPGGHRAQSVEDHRRTGGTHCGSH
ncbi:MAG: hypothetical protein ACREIS_09430 [Nitrospiraceae bacterium]